MPPSSKKCSVCGAGRALYGLLWDRNDRYCLSCSKSQHLVVNLFQNPYCIVCAAQRQEKPRRANFASNKQQKATWCFAHKPDNTIDTHNSRCECGKAQPQLGKPGDKRPRWCAQCPTKASDAVNLTSRRCICGKRTPNFGLAGDERPSWCAKCPTKAANAIDLNHKRCVCGRAQPVFGMTIDVQPQWCVKCKPAEAIDCKNRRCECGKAQPRFGNSGDKIPRWCTRCPTRSLNAERLYNRQCACGRAIPSFRLIGDARPTWCALCPNKPTDTASCDLCQAVSGQIYYR